MEEKEIKTPCKYISLAVKCAGTGIKSACRAIALCLKNIYVTVTEIEQDAENPAGLNASDSPAEGEKPAGIPAVEVVEKEETAATQVKAEVSNESREKTKTEVLKKIKYTFKYHNLKAKEVNVAMDFDDWNIRPMTRRKEGNWYATIEVSPGKYAYKFIVDGEWAKDHKNLKSQPDGYGGESSVLEIN